jgi:predicted transcriptional regulator
LEQGFVAERDEELEGGGKEYYLTEEGRNLLKGLSEVEEALE